MRARLLIASRTYLCAEALQSQLKNEHNLEIIGTACTLCVMKQLLLLAPDIVLADDALCEDLLLAPIALGPARVVLVSDRPALAPVHGDLQALVARGLSAILPNGTDLATLTKAIEAVLSGDLWIDHQTLKSSLYPQGSPASRVTLTEKERKILIYLCRGCTNREIAKQVCVCEQTIKFHFHRLFKKFGASNRISLALAAVEQLPELKDV